MKRSRAACDDDTPRQNGLAGQRTAQQQQQSDGEEGESRFVPADDDSPERRRELRSKYRDLINSVQRK